MSAPYSPEPIPVGLEPARGTSLHARMCFKKAKDDNPQDKEYEVHGKTKELVREWGHEKDGQGSAHASNH